jgi:hypothetical protein
VPVCPPDPPRNRDLDDQGEQVGRIGASSNSYSDPDQPGLLYCVAVMAVKRSGADVIVTVRVVNHGSTLMNLDNNDQIKVGLSYAGEVAKQDFGVDVTALAGVLPGGGQQLNGKYAFTVPQSVREVTVSAGPALSEDQGAWVGPVG